MLITRIPYLLSLISALVAAAGAEAQTFSYNTLLFGAISGICFTVSLILADVRTQRLRNAQPEAPVTASAPVVEAPVFVASGEGNALSAEAGSAA